MKLKQSGYSGKLSSGGLVILKIQFIKQKQEIPLVKYLHCTIRIAPVLQAHSIQTSLEMKTVSTPIHLGKSIIEERSSFFD